jgi:hypothetical protein
MTNLYTIAGTSRKNGVMKVRFANGKAAAREKALLKDGQTDIVLVDLPHEMNKVDAAVLLLQNVPVYQSGEEHDVLVDFLKGEGVTEIPVAEAHEETLEEEMCVSDEELEAEVEVNNEEQLSEEDEAIVDSLTQLA